MKVSNPYIRYRGSHGVRARRSDCERCRDLAPPRAITSSPSDKDERRCDEASPQYISIIDNAKHNDHD